MRSGHKRVALGELCEFVNGNGFKPTDWKQSGLPIIRIQNLNGSQTFNYFDGIPKARWIVESGDLLFAWAGVRGVSFGPTIWSGPRGVLNQHIYKVIPEKGVDPYWLYLALQVVTRKIESQAHGFKSSLVHVHKEDITSQEVDLPPLSQQRKIGIGLKEWERLINAASNYVQLKRQGLTALRHKLLGSNGEFRSDWQLLPLKALATRIRRSNDGGNHPVMTISAKSGFILQSDKYSRDMAGSSIEKYILLRKGEFSYNKGNSIRYPQGCVYALDRMTALVPFVYICFSLNDGLRSSFYENIFETGMLNRQLNRLINSGVRNDGLLNIDPDDFFSCMLPVPSRQDQEAIANILNTAKEEIALIERQIDLLSRQKRGLMQKLLTGEWRVTVPEESAA